MIKISLVINNKYFDIGTEKKKKKVLEKKL